MSPVKGGSEGRARRSVPREPPLIFLLFVAQRRWGEEFIRRLASAGYDDQRFAHHHVMGHLTFEGMRLTELAERAGITKQAMGELVSELEERGYVERVPDPSDRRAKIIRFARRGLDAIPVAYKTFTGMERELERRIGAKRFAELRRTLMEVIGEPPQPDRSKR